MANPQQTTVKQTTQPTPKPVGVKPRLDPTVKAQRVAKSIQDHERLITYRVDRIRKELKDMGVSSLASRITEYTDVSADFVEAALQVVENRVAACRAALKARTSGPTVESVDLKALAAKIAAQRVGVPAQGQ